MFSQVSVSVTQSPRRLLLGGFLLVIVVFGAFVTPVSAAEDPRFEVSVPEPELQPGAEQTLTLTITNDAVDVDDQVERASNVAVEARNGSTPIEVVSGERQIGSLADGDAATVNFRIDVPNDAPAGTYRLPLDVTYEFDGDEREETTLQATVEIPERPIFEIGVTDVDLHPKETGLVTLEVTNNGSQTATDTSLGLTSGNAALTFGGTAGAAPFLGTLEPNETTTTTVAVAASKTTIAQSYEVSVQPSYRDLNGNTLQAPKHSIGITPASEPRIVVVAASGSVVQGDTETLVLTLENVGSAEMHDAVLTLTSGASGLTIDAAPSTSQFVGDWAPGETKTVQTDISAASTVQTGTYPLETTVRFDHPEGIESQSGPLQMGFPVEAEATFRYSDVTVTHNGPRAVLRTTVTNEGDTPIGNAALVLRSTIDGVHVLTPSSSIGTLEPGESTTVTADIGVPTQKTAPQQFEAVVRYEGRDNESIESESTSIWAELETEEALFSVEPMTATLDLDQSNKLRVRVSNNGPYDLSNIRGQLAVREPYQSQSPTAFVSTLDAGETAVMTFEITPPPEGVETTDVFSLNLTAEGPDDRTLVDEPHHVPIQTVDETVFHVESVNATFDIDSSNELRVRITNNGSQPLTDIQAQLPDQPPYQSQSPTAYVPVLDPGESAIVTFEVTTPEDGVETADALAIEFTADRPDDRTVVDGPHLVPITVEAGSDATGDQTLIAILAVLVIVLLGGGWWWLNR